MALLPYALLYNPRLPAHASRIAGEGMIGKFNQEPHVWAGLAVFCALYALGRREAPKNTSSRTSLVAFAAGMASLALALLSPIDYYSEALAWVHMLQHTLILMVAAPLIAMAGPEFYGIYLLPSPRGRARAGDLIKLFNKTATKAARWKRPLAALLLYAAVLWIWHIPKFYEEALANGLLHDFQHLGFFAASFFFWRIVLYPFAKTAPPPAAFLYLFVSMIHAMALGALMALSPAAWYAPYKETAPGFGLTPLEDQQLAGFIMWMPAGLSFIAAALYSMKRALQKTEG